jgi:hypothetical protein
MVHRSFVAWFEHHSLLEASQSLFVSSRFGHRSGLFTCWDGFFVSIGQDFRADVASRLPSLPEPAALSPDATGGKVRCGAHRGKLVHQPIRNATTIIGPLLTPALQAAVGKPKSFFWLAPSMGDFHKFLINDEPIMRKGDRAIGKHNPEQSRSLGAPRTGAKLRRCVSRVRAFRRHINHQRRNGLGGLASIPASRGCEDCSLCLGSESKAAKPLAS